MKIKQKISLIVLTLTASLGVAMAPATTQALTCGGVQTSIIECKQGADAKTAETSPIWGVMLIVLNIMTAGVGVLAVGGIVYGAILYASAGDKAEQTKKAISIITNVVIGIVAYGLMYVLLNFLVPGGVFK
jgi:hypothetical protein